MGNIELAENETAKSKGKICKISNGAFSWVLEVDRKTIYFQGSENAEYFGEVYTSLGYIVEWDREKWSREQLN